MAEITKDDRIFLTVEEALALLDDGEEVHSFASPAGGVLIGADWSREDAIKAIENAKTREVAGPAAQGMKHGLAIMTSTGYYFLKTKTARMTA